LALHGIFSIGNILQTLKALVLPSLLGLPLFPLVNYIKWIVPNLGGQQKLKLAQIRFQNGHAGFTLEGKWSKGEREL